MIPKYKLEELAEETHQRYHVVALINDVAGGFLSHSADIQPNDEVLAISIKGQVYIIEKKA